jgi:hypothetical protein
VVAVRLFYSLLSSNLIILISPHVRLHEKSDVCGEWHATMPSFLAFVRVFESIEIDLVDHRDDSTTIIITHSTLLTERVISLLYTHTLMTVVLTRCV